MIEGRPLAVARQGEVAWHINSGWLETIPFLNHDVVTCGRADVQMQQLRVKVALVLRPEVYAPNEYPPDRRLYVIFNGLARFHGNTLKSARRSRPRCLGSDTRARARAHTRVRTAARARAPIRRSGRPASGWSVS